MKKNAIILFSLSLVFLMAGICQAAPYYGPIVMVEADPGLPYDLPIETNVTFTTAFYDPLWTLGEYTGGSFSAFSDGSSDPGIQVTKVAGTVVDFAIQSTTNPNNVLKLSDTGNLHAVTFWNTNSGVVEAPLWVTTWYDDASILWSGGPAVNIEIVTTDGDPDGLAAVPIPSAVLLLGSGMVGLVGFRKKFRS